MNGRKKVRMKSKKGFGDTVVGFASVIIITIFLLYVYIRTSTSTKYIVESFTLQTLMENGVEVSSYIQQSFLSPALLYSTMRVVYFASLHGGITNRFLEKHELDSEGFFNNVYVFVKSENSGDLWKKEACLKYDPEYRAIYWSIAEGTKIAEIPPFDYFKSYDKKIGTEPIKINFNPPYQSGDEDERKIGDVLLSFYFLKPGEIKVTSGNKILLKATRTGVYIISGSEIENNEITIVGSTKNLAILKTIISSPYMNGVVNDTINAIKEIMYEDYLNGLNGKTMFGYQINIPKDFSIDFSPSAKGMNTTIWFEKGITIKHKYYGKSPLPSSITYGINMNSDMFTEKTTIARYGLLIDYGIYFVKHIDDLVIPTIREFMDKKMQDYYITWKVSGCSKNLTTCPADETPTYSGTYIENNVVLPALKQIQDELNSKSAKGITWNLQLIEFDPDFQVNTEKNYCRYRDRCIPFQSFKNFVMMENQKTDYWIEYCHWCPEDPKSGYRHYCVVKYSHRYILKDLKILVTINDTKYKVFSPSTHRWVPLSLRFIVDINVDDNRCDNGRVAGYVGVAPNPPIFGASSINPEIALRINELESIKICQDYSGQLGDLNSQINPINSITLPQSNDDVSP